MHSRITRYSLLVVSLGALFAFLASASPAATQSERQPSIAQAHLPRAHSASAVARSAPPRLAAEQIASAKGQGIVGSEAFALRLDPNAPKRIEVNVSTQRVIAWQGDVRVFDFAATTGDEGSPTVLGEYELLDKIEQDAYSDLWGMTMPYWMGIYYAGDWEDGFHALPTLDDGEVVWGDALGKFPATHGCIVLSLADAKTLFDWADVGTLVQVHE